MLEPIRGPKTETAVRFHQASAYGPFGASPSPMTPFRLRSSFAVAKLDAYRIKVNQC